MRPEGNRRIRAMTGNRDAFQGRFDVIGWRKSVESDP
jgi:hypothetical protein